MTVELTVLTLAALLAVAQLLLYAVPANRTLGSDYLAGPRDEKRVLTGTPARLQRAFLNHIEGLVLFTIAVVVVRLGAASTPFTNFCAWTYLVSRVIYVPLYAYGVPWLRSLVWAAGFLATVAMLISVLI
ncbi:MAG: hypothetical protein CVT86_05195 [Alphaproteobacteria bacterium HGW-Alphaproteobacteria-8]|jgi:uncharacterized MAPEG superfamily protein|nr:MAG: hypothetical protein CVT86_05195 [Alphaproteobacteria bacterium HGW-Alphaproteobacteria-8]